MAYGNSRVKVIKFGRERAGFVVYAGQRGARGDLYTERG